MINYIEKLYSEAFDAGFEYAIEKLFTSDEDLKKYKDKIDTDDLTKLGHYPQSAGYLFGRLGGGRAASRAAKRAIKRGDTDEEVEKKSRRAAAIRAGIGSAIAGGGIIACGTRVGGPAQKAGIVAAGLGAGSAIYGSQRDAKKKAKELIERRENLINKAKLEEMND